jgi:predicted oxidoreductase (fatty acid repression mutant protein)
LRRGPRARIIGTEPDEEAAMETAARYDQRTRYDALMEVVRNRMTTRQFDPSYVVPREHYELILEAARHAPSGANAQPWHYVVVTEAATKRRSPTTSSTRRAIAPSCT